MPPEVAALDHRHLGIAPVDDYHVFHRRGTGFQGGVHVDLQGRRLATAIAGIGGDDQPGLGVLAAIHDGVGGETAKDHAVGYPDTGAGQHGHRQLGDHRHVDGDPVAALQAQASQDVGEPADLVQQIGVGDLPGVARLPLPEVGDAVAQASLHVPVQAVGRYVQLPSDEPLGEREVPIQGGVEVLVPGE